jgi:hypothetical protein
MTYSEENIYQDLINDYVNSIKSLQSRLAEAKSTDEITKITKLIEGYHNQVLKLKEAIN